MIKLLLVEDDASLRYSSGGLEDMIGGYEVIYCRQWRGGLETVEEQHPDVIVSI